jgi:hypothetical protein
MLTDQLKETVTHQGKFLTLSLVTTLQRRCIDEFMRLGVSSETIAYFYIALELLTKEFMEASEYAKNQEDFHKIIKDINLKKGE